LVAPRDYGADWHLTVGERLPRKFEAATHVLFISHFFSPQSVTANWPGQ
jgi:hypothetical protein